MKQFVRIWCALAGVMLTSGHHLVGANALDWRELVASGQLVDIRKFDPTIIVELRYATPRNCVGEAIYPSNFPCLTRPETAVRLRLTQRKLHDWGYRLKIWDAYRPPEAQATLYRRWAGRGYVANPDEGAGSLHTWGLAVDATLVDLLGREVSMPSGFDVFALEASAIYEGTDKKAAFHLHLLQAAMGDSGFMGLRNEWWHFAVKDWATRRPLTAKGAGQPLTGADRPADAPNLVTAPAQATSPKTPAAVSVPRTAKPPP